jgi:CHAT domain-containing protein/tetratricopeptide (TPR) repeat protein
LQLASDESLMEDRMRGVVAVLLALCAASAISKPVRISPAVATELTREAYSVQRLTAEGQLLYESASFFQRRTWGQYCAAAWELNEQGEFRLAVRAASQALFLGRRSNDRNATSFAKRDLSVSFSYSGNLDLAETYAREAIDESLGRADVVSVAYKVLGDVALRRGDARAASNHYRDALGSSSGSWRRLVQLSQANAMLASNNVDGAGSLAFADSGLSSGPEQLMAARLRGNILLASGKADESIREFRKYAALATGDDGAYHRVWAYDGESRALESKGDTQAARATLMKALHEAERVRARFRSEEFKTGMFGEMQDIFSRASRAFLKAGDHESAFDIAERGRSRALIDSLRGRVRVEGGLLTEPVGAASTARGIAKMLSEGDTLVVYMVDSESTSAWVLTTAGVRHVALPVGGPSLGDSVQALRKAIVNRSPGARDLSAPLHDQLIRPLGLENAKRLTIVPHGVLHHLPFQALWDGKRYLIQTSALSYAPSASMLAQIIGRNRQNHPRRVIAFGNPDLGDDALSLPAAEREVGSIKTTFPDAVVYVGSQATRSRFLAEAPAHSLIHVAAHAEFDAVDPLFSRVQLAGESAADGNLEAHEIYRMKLGSTSLVTLSACESGMTRITRGDEIWGFPRAFLAAGAPAVLLSLWPVADESTEKLMTAFYRSLQTMSAQDSLREAQLVVLADEQFAHPYFWAAFGLTGSSR